MKSLLAWTCVLLPLVIAAAASDLHARDGAFVYVSTKRSGQRLLTRTFRPSCPPGQQQCADTGICCLVDCGADGHCPWDSKVLAGDTIGDQEIVKREVKEI